MPDLLNIRLLRRGIKPQDVGGSGDCHFGVLRRPSYKIGFLRRPYMVGHKSAIGLYCAWAKFGASVTDRSGRITNAAKLKFC